MLFIGKIVSNGKHVLMFVSKLNIKSLLLTGERRILLLLLFKEFSEFFINKISPVL